jgi:hypothetical protein
MVSGPRVVPAGLVQHEHSANAWLTLTREVLQKYNHRIGVHPRQCEGLICATTAGSEQMQALEALINHAKRAHPTLIPDARRLPLLAEACMA